MRIADLSSRARVMRISDLDPRAGRSSDYYRVSKEEVVKMFLVRTFFARISVPEAARTIDDSFAD